MTYSQEKSVTSKLAELELEHISRNLETCLEQHSSSFRWLTASLLTLNTATLLTLTSLTIVGYTAKFYAAIALFFGIASALLISVTSQFSNARVASSLGDLAEALRLSAATGMYELKKLKDARAKLVEESRTSALWSPLMGYISFAFFSIAFAIILFDVWRLAQ